MGGNEKKPMTRKEL